MKHFLKKKIDKLLRAGVIQSILAWMVTCYIRFVYWWSDDFHYANKDRLDSLVKSGKPIIVVFWHSRIMMLPVAWVWKRPFYMLSSRHGISLILTKILRRFGVHSILGSTNRHGISAGIEIVEKLSQGGVVGITPDGPRGPSEECSIGVIRLAKLAAKTLGPVVIVASSYGISRSKRLRSWDRFIVPYPSARGVFMVGETVTVSADISDAEMEILRQKLQNNLNACTKEADAWARG